MSGFIFHFSCASNLRRKAKSTKLTNIRRASETYDAVQERFKISQLKCPKHGLHDEGASIIAKRRKFKIIESTLKQKLTTDLLLL